MHPVTKLSYINNNASFNLYNKLLKDDEQKCRKLLMAGDDAHRKCRDMNGGRCKVSYTNQIGLMPASWWHDYQFNVCLDSISDSTEDDKEVKCSIYMLVYSLHIGCGDFGGEYGNEGYVCVIEYV